MQFQFLLLLFLENIFEKQIFEGGFIALPGQRGDITEAILAMPNWIDILVSIITSTENLIFDIFTRISNQKVLIREIVFTLRLYKQ